MALGHKWAKRLKGGELIVVPFSSDGPNISWDEQQRLRRVFYFDFIKFAKWN